MKFTRSLQIIQVHCQGEIGKVLVGGTPVGLARRPLLELTREEKADFRKAMEPVLG